MRRLLRILSRLSLLGAVAAIAYRLVQRRSSAPLAATAPGPWPPIPGVEDPPPAVVGNGAAPPIEEPVAVETPAVTWLEPVDDTCPASHPVKAKLASGVFHLPGMLHYDRTKPDRCYPDPTSAEADGLRQAKR